MTDTPLADVCFRPIESSDLDFLRRVYAESRADEMAIVPWSDEEKAAFLEMQFQAQHTFYQQQFAGAVFQVIERSGEPIGRLYVERRDDEHRIIDIALLVACRGQGIGGAIMQGLLDEAAAAGKPVRIHVEKNNPAMRLYERLGFKKLEDQGVYDLMEWRPESG